MRHLPLNQCLHLNRDLMQERQCQWLHRLLKPLQHLQEMILTDRVFRKTVSQHLPRETVQNPNAVDLHGLLNGSQVYATALRPHLPLGRVQSLNHGAGVAEADDRDAQAKVGGR